MCFFFFSGRPTSINYRRFVIFYLKTIKKEMWIARSHQKTSKMQELEKVVAEAKLTLRKIAVGFFCKYRNGTRRMTLTMFVSSPVPIEAGRGRHVVVGWRSIISLTRSVSAAIFQTLQFLWISHQTR